MDEGRTMQEQLSRTKFGTGVEKVMTPWMGPNFVGSQHNGLRNCVTCRYICRCHAPVNVILIRGNSMIVKVISVRKGVEGMNLRISIIGTMPSPWGRGG